ncbi:MAG TPA: phosphatase PAP2 family protein [Candidatus Dormibacteraeota bacterium]|nr:phosphatase PAP2 family protein [Candidatus Dormibacteraeota bacterium]
MIDPSVHLIPGRARNVWRDLARILSTIFNPFLTSLALFVILSSATARTTEEFWKLLFVSAAFTSLGPMLFVFWLYASDRISDLDMSQRRERESVFSAFTLAYVLGGLILWAMHAPMLILAALAGYAVAGAIVQVTTRYWKISTHALGITAALTVLTFLEGRAPLPFMVLIPMVGWARVYLHSHTIAQVIGGSLLGIITVVMLFNLFHIPNALLQ